jgi:hypothetical protein
VEDNNNQQKEQMGFTLKTGLLANVQEQPIEQVQTDNKEVEPIETEENGEGTETSAFVKLHHWIYGKYHTKDGKVKGWLMGITLGVALALAIIAIRLVSK